MFASRLDEASRFTKTEAKQITPTKAREHSIKIVHEMSEYLFDIFDANMMEEYHIMETFEMKAMNAFINREDEKAEYTFEQQDLHKEFLKLFESLLDNFLVGKNLTMHDLYDEVKWYMAQDNVEALEVIEVIDAFSDFKKWADHMTRQAAGYRRQYEYVAQLQAAIEQADQKPSPSPKPSIKPVIYSPDSKIESEEAENEYK